MINNQLKKLLICIMSICIFFSSFISAFAHEVLLNIDYDECSLSINDKGFTVAEGEDEIWYYLYSPMNDSSIGSRINSSH